MKPNYSRIDEAISELQLELKARYVPQEIPKLLERGKMPTLTWNVSLFKEGRVVIETEFHQGYGYLPKGCLEGRTPFSMDWHQKLAGIFRTGRIPAPTTPDDYFGIEGAGKPLDPPTSRDFLWCMTLDSDVLNYASFEDWAENMGYDSDSRKAFAVYEECLKNSLKLLAAIGSDRRKQLQALFQDY